MGMQDRKAPRRRVFKAGMIAFNRDGGISCRVCNLSDCGACLEVASAIGIPEHFTLDIESSCLHRPCQVAWRSDNRIGVAFEA